MDAAVLVSRPAREPANGEDGGCCQHGDQMQVRQLALWRSGGGSRRSSRPVSIVGGATIKPAEIASSAPCAMAGSSTPAAPRTSSAAAIVYAPIETSVSGGCDGWPE